MYSKNDYRYYLESRLMHSSDYLSHERSHKYIKKIGDRYFYTQQELAAFMNKDRKSKNAERISTNITTGLYDTAIIGEEAPYRKQWDIRNSIGKSQYNGMQRTDKEKTRLAKESANKDQQRGKKLTTTIRSKETIKADQKQGKKRTEQLKGKSSEYLTELESNSKKNSLSKKSTKKKKKSNRKPFTIESLRRVKPKGKKLKGGGGITVTHNTVIK